MGEVTRHDETVFADEGAAGRADASLAVGCERDVGDTSVTAVQRPFSFAMADDEHSWGCHGVQRRFEKGLKRVKREERQSTTVSMETEKGRGGGCGCGTDRVVQAGKTNSIPP